MTLRTAIDQYIDWQRARGAIFASPANLLRRFSRTVGDALDCDAVSSDQAAAFIEGQGAATNYCYQKHRTLTGFYRYALARDLASRPPGARRPAPPHKRRGVFRPSRRTSIRPTRCADCWMPPQPTASA